MAGKGSSRDRKGAKDFEMRNERIPSGPSTRETMRKMQKSARWMDMVLAVVFVVLALRIHGSTHSDHVWARIWWCSAAFCAMTAATSPMEKVFNWAQRRFLGVKQG